MNYLKEDQVSWEIGIDIYFLLSMCCFSTNHLVVVIMIDVVDDGCCVVYATDVSGNGRSSYKSCWCQSSTVVNLRLSSRMELCENFELTNRIYINKPIKIKYLPYLPYKTNKHINKYPRSTCSQNGLFPCCG